MKFTNDGQNRILQAALIMLLAAVLFRTAVMQVPGTTGGEILKQIKEKPVATVPFEQEKQFEYVDSFDISFEKESGKLIFSCDFSEVPGSDDNYIYFLGQEIYEEDEDFSSEPICRKIKAESIYAAVDYKRSQLFKRYTAAILLGGEYVPLTEGLYASNPENLADNEGKLPDNLSKKGILIDAVTLGTPQLKSLNTTHAVYNMPLSIFVGTKEDKETPHVEFKYDGETYYFNENWLNTYDTMYKSLEEEGIYTTAIILNDWNTVHPELMHPLSRNPDRQANYFQFNTEEKEGVKLLEATALFLADRYSDGKHGRVCNWVIANEINQQKIWNYMDTSDGDYYAETFEKSFRLFYNAIKSENTGAHVYFSLDNVWNKNDGSDENYFNGREIFEKFNECAKKHGNYDWSIAIHPYPVPLTKVNYWSSQNDMSENAADLTIMNLSTITDMLERDEFKNPAGDVRSLAITELGYTSFSGEKLQAAAFAYCYKIVDNNPYVDMFLLNRETDSPVEMAAGLALGLYNVDYSEKYIKNVFSDIDGEHGDDYDQLILNILKADSMEEALSWALKNE